MSWGRRMLLVLAVIIALVAAIALASSVATARFRARFEAEKAELLQRGRAARPNTIDAGAVAALPPPVRKYLEVTGTIGKPTLKTATLQQRGGIRTGADKVWMPFEAEQVYSMDPPGFVWLARAQVAPLFHMMARDKFVDGQGNMLIRILGLFTVADGRGPEMDQGAGLRHWGEVFNFPESVVHPFVRWEPIDDLHARVHIDQQGLKLNAVVEFNADGLPIATHADRYRDVNGKGVLTPWTGRSLEWKVVDGRLFPTHWESIWHLPEGDFLAVKMETYRVQTE